MAFKKMEDHDREMEKKYENSFLLRNDGDFQDVIILYQSYDDVLIADAHYIKSDEYTGYVHCIGNHCPACAKGLQIRSKLFIPLYNISQNRIQFWDRNLRFENQLNRDVFSRYPNPSEIVFRITRHGDAGDMNTTYDIRAVGRNSFMSYGDVLKGANATFPDYYDNICKEVDEGKLNKLLSTSSSGNTSSYVDYNDIPDYQIQPRNSASNDIPDNLPDFTGVSFDDNDNISSDDSTDGVDDVKF